MVEAAAQVYCTPAVEVDMRVYRPEGRSVLVASVGPAVRKPVLVKEEDGRRLAYVRVADENILASPVHIGLWKCEADDGRVHEVPDFAILRQDPVSVTFTEQERELLAVVAAASGGLTLSQICRRVTIPRRRVTCSRFSFTGGWSESVTTAAAFSTALWINGKYAHTPKM